MEQESCSYSTETTRQTTTKKLSESLYELHKPQGEPSVQIIFFHGFQVEEGSDPHLSTWRSGHDSAVWPQTWLVDEFLEAHVFTVAYNAELLRNSKGGKVDMYIIVENILSDLLQEKIGQNPHCPIVLVGHSLGGLVMKELCLQARNRGTSQHESFLSAVKGFFFYSTPHRGIPNVGAIARFLSDSPLLDYMETLGNPTARMNDEFEKLVKKHGWQIAGVGENLPTKLSRFPAFLVVPEASARYGDFFNVITTADHITVCKPVTKYSASFKRLTEFLHNLSINSMQKARVGNYQHFSQYGVTTMDEAYSTAHDLTDFSGIWPEFHFTMGELVAAGTAFSVVSSIVTFAEVSWRIIMRVNEFVNDNGDVPEVLADVKAQLPLLIETMDKLKSLGEERLQKIEPQSALAEAVTGCRSHVDRLEILVKKLQRQVTDWRIKNVKKASQSLFYEGEISKILIKLEGYKTSFILHFTNMSIDLDKVTAKDEAYYMVPGLQVSEYVKRIDLLESVKSAVQQRREQQQRQVVVLLGMGGQGKSQLAMEYCRTTRLSKEFRAIFWIDASSIKSAHRDFERIASKIADPSRKFENIEEKVAFVKDTMDGWDSRWLLVFDNYDAPSTDFNVAAFFPSSALGTILVTSRHEDSKRLGKVIPLTKMTEQESLLLLFRRSENELADENMATGKSIVAKLGFLPLAIDQAGAFISEQKLPLTQFLERFDLQKEEILKYTHSLTEYKRILGDDVKETALNVFTTWELSFQQIQKGEAGQRLRSFLTTAAFFNTGDIGEDLFHSANSLETVPSWINAFISEGKWDSVRYRKVLAELSKLSLLNFAREDTKQCRFYLHPLIADWLRLRVGLEIRRLCTIESCYLLAKLIESTDLRSCSYAFRLYLLEHVDECLNNKRTYSKPVDEDAGFAKILTAQFGNLLRETSRYREGISLLEEALPIIETAYGKDHEWTLYTVHELGVLYSGQGKFAEAEEMYNRALAGQEKALGKDHASTLTTVHNLGDLYYDQGKSAEAEEMYNRALAGREKALGKDHASTLNTVHALGVLYYDQGKSAEAEEMYNRALAGNEKALGKDHALTLTTVNNLGLLYSDQGKSAEAEEMYNRALAGKEKALGKDHASTLSTVHNLGLLYSEQGKSAKAEEMYNRALAGSEKALGKDHASTLTTVHNLGDLYYEQGKSAEAEEMYNRALAGKEKALGKDHASTLATVHNLGLLYYEQGKLAEAEEMYNRALAGKEKALGKDHASTLVTVHNLGLLYKKQGKSAEAEEMYNRALAGYEKALGKDHVYTLRTVYNMAMLMEKQEDLDGASQMFERAYIGYKNRLGADNDKAIDARQGLERIRHLQQKKVNPKKGFLKSLRQRFM